MAMVKKYGKGDDKTSHEKEEKRSFGEEFCSLDLFEFRSRLVEMGEQNWEGAGCIEGVDDGKERE